jgi:hypothetical protein
MLKAEIGDYAGTNTTRDGELNTLLSNMQIQLKIEYRWSFLLDRWEVSVASGQQFVTFPTVNIDGGNTTIDLDEMKAVSTYWNTIYQPVDYGIGVEEYNIFNPKLGSQSDPIQKWRERDGTSVNQFEVWPIPATGQVIRFEAERMLDTLVSDSDTADLDDLLLVTAVASGVLARTKQEDAKAMSARFIRRLKQLGQRNRSDDNKRILGRTGYQERIRIVNIQPNRIAVH